MAFTPWFVPWFILRFSYSYLNKAFIQFVVSMVFSLFFWLETFFVFKIIAFPFIENYNFQSSISETKESFKFSYGQKKIFLCEKFISDRRHVNFSP